MLFTANYQPLFCMEWMTHASTVHVRLPVVLKLLLFTLQQKYSTSHGPRMWLRGGVQTSSVSWLPDPLRGTFKIETIFLPPFCMGVKTWCLILGHECRLCSRKGCWEYLEPKLRTEEEASEKLYSVELHDSYYRLSPVKKSEIGRACGMHWREMRCETLREFGNPWDPDQVRRLILE